MVVIYGYEIDTTAVGLQAVNILYIICSLIIVGGIGLFVWFIRQFKHKFRIRETVNNRKIIFDDKARIVKDRDSIEWWQLLKRREKLPVPPTNAIEIDSRGVKSVEAYRTETGDYVYCIDDIQDMDGIIEVPILDKEGKQIEITDKQGRKKIAKQKSINKFKPFPTEQRLVLLHQYRKANSRRKKQLSDYLPTIIAIGALVVIVVALFIFYGDMAKPVLQMGDKQVEIAKMQKDMMEAMRDWMAISKARETNQSYVIPPS